MGILGGWSVDGYNTQAKRNQGFTEVKLIVRERATQRRKTNPISPAHSQIHPVYYIQ